MNSKINNEHSVRYSAGSRVEPLELGSVRSRLVRIPDDRRLVHLQFRRFAGCPVCSLHLRSIVRRHEELEAASIREVVVFHSTAELLLPYAADLPFDVIADPGKELYAAFGVESAPRALIDPRAWLPIVRGVLRSLGAVLLGREPLPSTNPAGGRFGLPADFLIGTDGRILECKYGSHVYDQWSVDEILALTREVMRARRSDPSRGGHPAGGRAISRPSPFEGSPR